MTCSTPIAPEAECRRSEWDLHAGCCIIGPLRQYSEARRQRERLAIGQTGVFEQWFRDSVTEGSGWHPAAWDGGCEQPKLGGFLRRP
jgi:hypothetical protein